MSRLVYCKDSEPATLPISITTQEPTNVIEIQPKAVKRFRENIESLAQIVRDKDGEASPEIAVPFRQLVAAVVVNPTEKGQPYEVNIKGNLSTSNCR